MKFRRLTSPELESLKDQFITFLIVKGITADQWVTIKTTQNDHALQVVHEFSDYVIETALREVQYLTFKGMGKMVCYHIDQSAQDAYLLQLVSENTDFSTMEVLSGEIQGSISFSQVELGDEPLQTLFRMTENGYKIDQGYLFHQLKSALEST